MKKLTNALALCVFVAAAPIMGHAQENPEESVAAAPQAELDLEMHKSGCLPSNESLAVVRTCFERWLNTTSTDPERRSCAERYQSIAEINDCVAEFPPKYEVGPWKAHDTNAGVELRAGALGAEGWKLSLICGRGGLQATLRYGGGHYSHRIAAIRAKTSEKEKAIDLTAVQSLILPGLVRLKGVDALEDGLLKNERVVFRFTLRDADDYTSEFAFPGMKAAAAVVRKTCPPF